MAVLHLEHQSKELGLGSINLPNPVAHKSWLVEFAGTTPLVQIKEWVYDPDELLMQKAWAASRDDFLRAEARHLRKAAMERLRLVSDPTPQVPTISIPAHSAA